MIQVLNLQLMTVEPTNTGEIVVISHVIVAPSMSVSNFKFRELNNFAVEYQTGLLCLYKRLI